MNTMGSGRSDGARTRVVSGFQRAKTDCRVGKDSNDDHCIVESAAGDCFTAQQDTEMVSVEVERG